MDLLIALLKDLEMKIMKHDNLLKELEDNVSTACARLEYVNILEKKMNENINEMRMEHKELEDDVFTVCARLEYVNILEKKMNEKIDETCTTEPKLLRRVADVEEDVLAFRTRVIEDVNAIEDQADNLDSNMTSLKNAVQSALNHMTGGQISIVTDVDVDTNTDDEG